METKKISHAQYAPGGKVRILKFVKADGTAMNGNGFQWPESGVVEAPDWDPEPVCPKDGKGGGLFGWAWGVGVGDGSDPEYSPLLSRWIVVEADPDEVTLVGKGECKVKFLRGEVVYFGGWQGAYALVIDGQIDWIKSQATAKGAQHTEDNCAPASSAGYCAPASSAGDWAPASSAGYCAPASSAGYRAPASSAGDRAPASSAGVCAPASSAGVCAPASSAGDESPASCGPCAVASACGERSTLTCEYGGICAVTAEECYWIPEPETVLVQHWAGKSGWQTVMLVAKENQVGQKLHVVRGRVIKP